MEKKTLVEGIDIENVESMTLTGEKICYIE